MTPEARLDRIERVAILLVRAGYRARKEFRAQLLEHNRRIEEHARLFDHIADLQIENEKKFALNEERFAILAESQVNTDHRLRALIEIVRERDNGDATPDTKF